MRECLDEGILQSYFDGELSSADMEGVTSHLVSCMSCAVAARELEGEFLLLSSALAPEFDATVPTERLRHRIDVAVAGLQLDNQNAVREPVVMPGRGWLQSISALFAFTPQRTFGYAALAVMLAFGTMLGVIHLRQSESPTINNEDKVAAVPQPTVTETPNAESNAKPGSNAVSVVTPVTPTPPASTPAVAGGRVRRTRPRQPATESNQAVAEVKLLPGERSYLKTIAALDSTIKSKSNRPMRPSLRAEYERNLAVVDRALAATRNAAKKNPNDPDAAEFMFNAYQSKVDLLNTVADARLYNRP
ncbi:MAG: anti-sigma factor [Pyrinomonadaceae bacterium]